MKRILRPPAALGWFLLHTVVAVLLFVTSLNSFFLADDLSILRIAASGDSSWADCLRPMTNGFWRPAILLAGRAIAVTVGLQPWAFHLAAILIHAGVATLVLAVTTQLYPGRRAGPLASLFFLLHIGTWECGIQFANAGDSILAGGVLLGVWMFHRWTTGGSRRHILGVVAGFVIALAGKESAVMFPLILVAHVLILGASNRRRSLFLALCLLGTSALFAAVVVRHQVASGESYAARGAISLSPKNAFRQFCDYWTSLFMPYLHVATGPFYALNFGNRILWAFRLVMFGSFVLLVWSAWRTRDRRCLFLVSAIVVMLVPACGFTTPPSARYLYTALAFFSILIAGALVSAPRHTRILMTLVLAPVVAWSLLGFYFAPHIHRYQMLADRVELVTQAMVSNSADWTSGSTIAILNHPHPGEDAARWVYAQHLAKIFLPDRQIEITLQDTPAADRVYRFTGTSLERIR